MFLLNHALFHKKYLFIQLIFFLQILHINESENIKSALNLHLFHNKFQRHFTDLQIHNKLIHEQLFTLLVYINLSINTVLDINSFFILITYTKK